MRTVSNLVDEFKHFLDLTILNILTLSVRGILKPPELKRLYSLSLSRMGMIFG